MMAEIGYCNGVENYSRHLTGRGPGEPPPTLIEYLPTDALIFLDESHMTVPQLNAMYTGDRSRKRPSWIMVSGSPRPWTTGP